VNRASGLGQKAIEKFCRLFVGLRPDV